MELDKQTIRKTMKQKRLFMDKETFFHNSKIILDKVIHHPIYKKASVVGVYVSMNNEVDTLCLIQHMLKDHVVATPKVDGNDMEFYRIESLNDLKEGHFHVLEPTTNVKVMPSDIDLMIVPMLAYDKNNHRVGYGKGYYDKYFSKGFKGYKLGLAFSWQEVSCIQTDEFDYPLDEVLNEV